MPRFASLCVAAPASCAAWIGAIDGLVPGTRIAAPATRPPGWHDEVFVGADGNGDLLFALCVDLAKCRSLLATITLPGVPGNYTDRVVPVIVGEGTKIAADLLVAIERALRSPDSTPTFERATTSSATAISLTVGLGLGLE